MEENLKMLALIFILLTSTPVSVITQQDMLSIIVYNPLSGGVFPVTSSLVYSHSHEEAILFDAQFSTKDGQNLEVLIKRSGKRLKRIIITCGDPDFYFGLEPVRKAYPHVEVVSSPKVATRIRDTKDAKLMLWAPMLKDGAPSELYVPNITLKTTFTIGGQPLELRSRDNYAAYIWIPRSRVILGGTGIGWGFHVFTADTQTPEIRASWRQVLQEMLDLKPEVVIPGHYVGDRPPGDEAIKFTLQYLEIFEEVLEANDYKNSTAVIVTMKALYPGLGLEGSLELSAKVNTGEMKF
ncbi:uncharacterized protein LOC135845066 [Planococcus citri]|uniref:uncharacterized protein LOC135845066 n=1 Tax=Planococcus citri TaxID=170843 RepID=UPI0031F79017